MRHTSYCRTTSSKSFASKSDIPMIASRAVRTTPIMLRESVSKISIPAQPPKKIQLLRTGCAPA